MKKLSSFPVIASAGLFGMVAFIAALIYSLIMGNSLISSDDPYIIGLVLACISSLGALIYFALHELNFKRFKQITGIAIYYCLIAVYFLSLEYVGGEASGFGYFFLIAVALSLPIVITYIVYAGNRKTVYAGFLFGLLFLIGYAPILFRHL